MAFIKETGRTVDGKKTRFESWIRAHVLICFLAYYMVKWMEERLREKGVTEVVKRVNNR